ASLGPDVRLVQQVFRSQLQNERRLEQVDRKQRHQVELVPRGLIDRRQLVHSREGGGDERLARRLVEETVRSPDGVRVLERCVRDVRRLPLQRSVALERLLGLRYGRGQDVRADVGDVCGQAQVPQRVVQEAEVLTALELETRQGRRICIGK